MLERDAKVIEESMARFACLGLGLLYLNLQVEGWLYLESAFCVLFLAFSGSCGRYDGGFESHSGTGWTILPVYRRDLCLRSQVVQISIKVNLMVLTIINVIGN